MAKIIKKNVLKKDNSSHEERLMVLVENLGDEIKLVAEGNLMLQERMESMEKKMDAGFEKVWDKFDSIDARFDSLNVRLDSIDARVDSLEKDMRGGFKMVAEFLVRIEGESAEIKIDLRRLEEKKADKEAMLVFEKRVAKIERELEECKNLCKNK